MQRRLLRFALCVAAGLASAGAVRAVPETLLRKNPFQPAGNAQPVAQPQNGRLELRCILSLDGKPRFTIFDTSNNRAIWLAVGESEGGIRVEAYDAAAEAVTVALEGQSVRLTMKEAQIVNVAVSMPAPGASAPAAIGTPAPGVNPPPPANEQEIQERRNRIIEELRRRRALRQAGQQPQSPTPQQ